MFKESIYSPIPEAQTDRLWVDLSLPFGTEKKIGLDVRRIHTLLQLGGIRNLRLTGEDGGRVSRGNVSIVGVGKNGEALGGHARQESISIYANETLEVKGEFLTKHSSWIDLETKLHVGNVKQTLLDSQRDVGQPDNWVPFINRTLKLGILGTGWRHLMGDFRAEDKILLALSAGYVVGTWRAFFPDRPDLLMLHWSIVNAALMISEGSTWGNENKGRGRRASLFFGYELDRALILGALTGVSRLAKRM